MSEEKMLQQYNNNVKLKNQHTLFKQNLSTQIKKAKMNVTAQKFYKD